MSIYTSSTNRVTGLSGIDTDSMVDQLMTAESAKYNNLQRKQQWKVWQQDAFRTVIDKLQTFQKSYFSTSSTKDSLKFQAAFQNFKSSVVDAKGNESNAISVSNITNSGSYEISVEQLATTTKYTSSKLTSEIKSSATLESIADAINIKDEMGFSVTYDGVTKNITLNREDDFGGAVDNFDTSALVDKINEKLADAFGIDSVSGEAAVQVDTYALESGDYQGENSLKFITSGDGHSLSVGATKNYGASVKGTFADINDENASDDKEERTMWISMDKKTYEITVNVTGKETPQQMASKLNSALKSATLKIDNSDDPVVIDPEKPKKVNISGSLSFSATDEENGFELKSKKYNTEIEISNYGEIIEDVDNETLYERAGLEDLGFSETTSNKINVNNSLKSIFTKLKTAYDYDEDYTGDEDITLDEDDPAFKYLDESGALTMEINGTKVSIGTDKSLDVLMEKINTSNMGVKLSYNSIKQEFSLETSSTGVASKIEVTDEKTKNILNDIFGIDVDNTTDDEHYQKGVDAIFTIDGVRTSRASNTVDVDGLSFTINSKTTETLTIKAEQDVDATYDKIQGFVDSYNDLITTLSGLTNEKRAKSDDYSYYEPLTSAEKDAMTDDEVEQWEEKAKTGLLYRDSTISSLLSKMRSALYGSVTLENGKSIGLYDIGITTSSDYSGSGKLEIDEDKLKKAISENGSSIVTLFTKSGTGIADQLDKILDSAVGTKGTLRAKAGIEGTSSEDSNTLSKEIKDLNDRITQEKERLIKKENAYYLKFSQMESAISKQNSQMNYITSLLS